MQHTILMGFFQRYNIDVVNVSEEQSLELLMHHETRHYWPMVHAVTWNIDTSHPCVALTCTCNVCE